VFTSTPGLGRREGLEIASRMMNIVSQLRASPTSVLAHGYRRTEHWPISRSRELGERVRLPGACAVSALRRLRGCAGWALLSRRGTTMGRSGTGVGRVVLVVGCSRMPIHQAPRSAWLSTPIFDFLCGCGLDAADTLCGPTTSITWPCCRLTSPLVFASAVQTPTACCRGFPLG
jgi:hypothetical protein